MGFSFFQLQALTLNQGEGDIMGREIHSCSDIALTAAMLMWQKMW
jgi:hypothetical protein